MEDEDYNSRADSDPDDEYDVIDYTPPTPAADTYGSNDSSDDFATPSVDNPDAADYYVSNEDDDDENDSTTNNVLSDSACAEASYDSNNNSYAPNETARFLNDFTQPNSGHEMSHGSTDDNDQILCKDSQAHEPTDPFGTERLAFIPILTLALFRMLATM